MSYFPKSKPTQGFYTSWVPTCFGKKALAGAIITTIVLLAFAAAATSSLFFNLHSFPAWYRTAVHIVNSKWVIVILAGSGSGAFLTAHLSIAIIKKLRLIKKTDRDNERGLAFMTPQPVQILKKPLKILPPNICTEESDFGSWYLSGKSAKCREALPVLSHESKKILAESINQTIAEFEGLNLKSTHSANVSIGVYCSFRWELEGKIQIILGEASRFEEICFVIKDEEDSTSNPKLFLIRKAEGAEETTHEMELSPLEFISVLRGVFQERYKNDFQMTEPRALMHKISFNAQPKT